MASFPSLQLFNGCCNCHNNQWVQDENVHKRCSGCKFISYCSKECQKEHWELVHKLHCKYLAEKAVKSKSRHIVSECLDCISVEKSGGLEEIRKKDNSVLPCPLSRGPFQSPSVVNLNSCGDLKPSAPIPFALPEMSGDKFLSQVEHLACTMLRLLYKIELIQHPAWMSTPVEDFSRMFDLVIQLRVMSWFSYIVTPSHSIERSIRNVIGGELLIELRNIIEKIDGNLTEMNYADESVFRPWESYKVLFQMIEIQSVVFIMVHAESSGLPQMAAAVKKTRLTSDQILSSWKKLLGMMSGKLVPYTKLVQVLCGGQLDQVCCGCCKDIRVVDVVIMEQRDCKVPFATFGPVQVFLCGDVTCSIKIQWRRMSSCVMTKCLQISTRVVSFRCDSCGLVRSMVHRCSKCLTKVYCGVECRDEDWRKVHKLVCRKGEVQRKIKGGKQDRKEESDKSIEFFTELFSQVFTSEMDFEKKFEKAIKNAIRD